MARRNRLRRRAARLACYLTLSGALAGLSTVAPQPALARRTTDLGYRYDQVWTAAVRLVRVDYGFNVTERDQELGAIERGLADAAADAPAAGEAQAADVAILDQRGADLRRLSNRETPVILSVLVIEDNPGNREYLLAAIERAGYAVRGAGTGTEGIAP